MRKVLLRPTHFTFHREGPAPRFRAQADEASALVRIEFAARPQLFTAPQASARTPETYFDSAAGAEGVTAQRLQLAGGKLTYELPNPVWERLRGNAHVFYRVTASDQATPDWAGTAPHTVRSVDDGQAAAGRAHYFGVPRDPLNAPWNFPDQEALEQVSPYYRAKLTLLTRYPESYEGAYLLRRFVGHDNYTALATTQRAKALLVFAATDMPARRALLQLFDRKIPAFVAGGSPAPAVRSQDLSAAQATLLDNLTALVDLDPHLDIPDGGDILVAEAIEEVADPSFEINQGTKGTCVPTSVSWLMATYFPAEYVRLATGLLAEGGKVALANGDQAAVPADTYAFDRAEQSTGVASFLRRSWFERLFQSSMMSYSRPGLTYSNIRDVFTDARGGLTMDELCRMLRGLRNRSHQAIAGAGSDLVARIVQQLQQPSLPVLTQMKWGTGSHEVVSVRADVGEVTFRNPWGGMNYRVGQVLAQPPRRCVNPSSAEEAMASADLATVIQSLVMEA